MYYVVKMQNTYYIIMIYHKYVISNVYAANVLKPYSTAHIKDLSLGVLFLVFTRISVVLESQFYLTIMIFLI